MWPCFQLLNFFLTVAEFNGTKINEAPHICSVLSFVKIFAMCQVLWASLAFAIISI